MAFFKKKRSDGVWFDYPAGGRVKLCLPSVDDYVRVKSECTEHRPFVWEQEGKNPKVLDHEVTDENKSMRMINDISIKDWEDFFYDEAKEDPIPCNIDTKNDLMRDEDPTFREFVKGKMELLEKAAKEEREKREKNSQASQSGDSA